MALLSPPRLLFRHFAAEDEVFHLARSVKVTTSALQLHRHDFAEICWVETGEGLHHLNGASLPLVGRDMFFILPEDCHGFEARPNQAMTLVNLAFPAELVDELRRRYFPDERRWFWGGREAAGCTRLPPDPFARVSRAADRLAFSARDRFPRDWFLLQLFHELGAGGQQAEALPEDLPDWLRRACQAIGRPEQFREGIREFHRLAGKSAEHVARTMKRQTGLTPTEYVNRVRLDYAARQLRMARAPVTQVAYDSGFGNLSHFFHLFRNRFGCSPSAYRRRRRQDIA